MSSRQVRIVCVPGVMSGDPVVQGTRVLAESVAIEMISGASLDEIAETYPTLPRGSIAAVMRWHFEQTGDDLSTTYAARQLSNLSRQLQQAILADFFGPADRLQRHFGEAAVEQRFDALDLDPGITELLRPAHRRARALLQLVDEVGMDDGLGEAVARVRRSLSEMEAWSR